MKKLIIVFGIAVLLCGGAGSASAGVSYHFDGTFYGYVQSMGISIPLMGYNPGEPAAPMGVLEFVDGFTPTPGGSFTTADVADFVILNKDGSVFLYYEQTVAFNGTFGTELTNGYPEIETFFWDKTPETGGDAELLESDIFRCYQTPMGVMDLMTDARMYSPVTYTYTGIQITGATTDIASTLSVGDSIQFTVNALAEGGATIYYQFFTRAGYGLPSWGGNPWTVVQDWSAANSVSITFNTPGIYFVAGHLENTPGNWAFGDPQTGIVVEVHE